MRETARIDFRVDEDLKKRIREKTAMAGSSGSLIMKLSLEYVASLDKEELKTFVKATSASRAERRMEAFT